VSLSAGRVVDGVVKAIMNRTDGVRLQVDYGKDETAVVYLWQVRGLTCSITIPTRTFLVPYITFLFALSCEAALSSVGSGAVMYNAELVRSICEKIAGESDPLIVRDLSSLLLSVIRDNHEEVRFRIAYLARAYRITFDESKGPRAQPGGRAEAIPRQSPASGSAFLSEGYGDNPEGNAMDLKYPQWQEPLAAAILEFNRDLLREKAQRADEAISQRIEQLAFDLGNEREHRLLFDGLDLLRSVRKERLGIPEAKGE
jgi:hypothetical protein